MTAFFDRVFRETSLHHPRLQALLVSLRQRCASKYVLWILVGMGIIRGVILLLAYPPAHASDSDLFFLYAERLSGYDLPLLDHVTYPLYPFLILVTYKWLGSAYWLIAVQFAMSISIAPLYYIALRGYSVILAAFVGLVILSDVQVGTTFNFSGAEPLYIFLTALMFAYLLPPMAGSDSRRASIRDSFPGILLMLLWLTRSIGRYLILPYALVYWFYTRNWKRSLTMIAGFLITWGLYSLLSTLVLGQVVGLTATDYAFARVMNHHESWVVPENGPNSRLWLETVESCLPPTQFHQAYCLYQRGGEWAYAEEVIQGAAIETILSHPTEYIGEVWQNTLHMLASSAEIYNQTEELISDVQCDGVHARTDQIDAEFIRTGYINRVTGPMLEYAGDPPEEDLHKYRETMRTINTVFCPPTPNVPELREIVDVVMERNRSFGRPNPHLWYGALLLLSGLLPSARRFLPAVLIVGGTMIMLSVSPAALSVHTNVRYVLVINTLRIVLLSILLFILVRMVLHTLDWLLTRKASNEL